jgi:hypothetical protein
VRSLIVNNVSARLVAALGDQTGVEPLVDEAVREALVNRQVTAEVRAAAASLQSQLLTGHASSLTLSLPEIGPAMAAVIEHQSPALAAEVESLGTITVVDVRIAPSAAQAVNDLAYLGRDATLLIILTFALAVLALLLARDRRRTLTGLGLGTAVSGLLAAAVYLAGKQVILGEFSSQDAHTAAAAVWNVYLGGLESSGFVLAGIGAAVAAVAALAGVGAHSRAATRGWPAA